MDSNRITITAALRRFNSCHEDWTPRRNPVKEWMSTEYECDNDLFRKFFRLGFLWYGICTEGHVSILFVWNPPKDNSTSQMALTCTASVIDASGRSRFPQSLAINSGRVLEGFFGFEKFVERSTLMSDPSELLPRGILTLCLEIELCFQHSQSEEGFQDEVFGFFPGHLEMNTDFGKFLCEMSPVFRDMMNYATDETEPLQLQPKEWGCLFSIHNFFTGSNLRVRLRDISELYIFADKYDMQPITELCHRLLISLMRVLDTENIMYYVGDGTELISNLATRFEDDVLREFLQTCNDIRKKIKGCTPVHGASNPIRLETEWNCEKEISKFVFRKFGSEPLLSEDSFK